MSFLSLLNLTATPNLTTSEAYLPFTSSDLDTVTLLHNSNFTESLGCFIDNDHVSCNETCGNLTAILSNWPNFYTCSWYPSLSETLDTTNITGSERDTVNELGIFGSQQELSSNISSTLAHCLADYCLSSAECLDLDISKSCLLENLLSANESSGNLNRENAFSCMRNGVCSSTSDVNPDIGGLGVVLSLIIQYTISLLALVLHGLFNLRFYISQRRITRHPSPQHSNQQIQHAKQKLDRHLEALTSALIEFQKSQCFFAATLQIAALIVIPSYLAQVRGKDQILLNLASANAFSPIMVTLAHIDLLGGRNSWYILFLSTVTFVLGSATYWDSSPTLSGTPFEASLFYTNPPAPLLSCGNVQPFAPCYLMNEFYQHGLWPVIGGVSYKLPEKTGLVVWIISLTILFYKVVIKILAIRQNKPRAMRHVRDIWSSVEKIMAALTSSIDSIKLGHRIISLWRQLRATLGLTIIWQHLRTALGKERSWDYGLLGLGTTALVIQLVTVAEVLRYSSNIIATQMSFGQIVAVGIWVPVLLEYGYLEINGAKEGTEYRLKQPLVVVNQVTDHGNTIPKIPSSTGGTSSLNVSQGAL